MARSPDDVIIERHKTCLFPLVLFILVGGSVSLQSYGVIKLDFLSSGNGSYLCKLVPDSDSCTVSHINSTRSEAEKALLGFVIGQAFCLLLQNTAFVLLCSRILSCAEICVKGCHKLWECACVSCGNVWMVLEAISGEMCLLQKVIEDTWVWTTIKKNLLISAEENIMNVMKDRASFSEFGGIETDIISDGIVSIISAIILAASPLSAEDIRQINGFVPCVITGVFGIVKSIGYCVYHQKVGFPPNDVFLGKNLKYSDVKVTPHVQHDTDVNGNPRQLVTHTMHY